MKKLTAEQLLANWDEFIGYIDTYITGDRKDKLKKFYEDRQDRLLTMPASAVEHYHSAFPGGYIEHVNRVIRMSIDVTEMWSKHGSPLDCTMEEIIFVAINHDLGKYGSDEEPYYVPNPSDWHRVNQGKIYEYGNDLSKMPVPDRSIFLLVNNDVKISENEYIGIQTHDGMYDEANKAYLITFGWTQKPKSSLCYIVHQADMMAARIEFEEWRDNYRDDAPPKKTTKTKTVSKASNPISKGAFDDIFKTTE